MPEYSRENPSPKYRELIELYQNMHEHGDPGNNLSAEKTFDGSSLLMHIDRIGALCHQYKVKSLFDYGCGKATHYRNQNQTVLVPGDKLYPSIPAYWGLKRLHLYDPGYSEFSTLPGEQFEGVICTDVLEHVPEDDLPWMLEELFRYATRFVFANIANYPAKKILPNGENAHCTIQPSSWWKPLIDKVASKYPNIGYFFVVENLWSENGQSYRNYHELVYNTSGLQMPA